MSRKSVTWAQFEAGVKKLPEQMRGNVLQDVRKDINTNMQVLERWAELLAYKKRPFASLSRQKNRKRTPYTLTGNLKRTIDLFENKKNKSKAYVVLGERMRMGGGGYQADPAYYARFVKGGYSPGKRTRKELRAANPSGALSTSGAKKVIRDARRKSGGKFIPGKDYFGKIPDSAINKIEAKLFKRALQHIDKMLETI